MGLSIFKAICKRVKKPQIIYHELPSHELNGLLFEDLLCSDDIARNKQDILRQLCEAYAQTGLTTSREAITIFIKHVLKNKVTETSQINLRIELWDDCFLSADAPFCLKCEGTECTLPFVETNEEERVCLLEH